MSFNFITAAEAASYIKDGDIVGLSGFTPAGSPKAVTAEHEKARKILAENREKLDELAMYLYEKETITGDEFMDILDRK